MSAPTQHAHDERPLARATSTRPTRRGGVGLVRPLETKGDADDDGDDERDEQRRPPTPLDADRQAISTAAMPIDRKSRTPWRTPQPIEPSSHSPRNSAVR